MKIEKIVLDLDDVCNDFTMTALKMVGCEIESSRDFESYDPKWGFDILKAANSLHKTKNFTKGEFWDCFSAEDWVSFPKSEEFFDILNLCLSLVEEENILILTSPICGEDISMQATRNCLAGKYDWIIHHFPSFMHRSFSMSPMKQFCATPSTLLIDDSGENVSKFRSSGGLAILFPRPWNNNHGLNTRNHMNGEIQKILAS